jgi:hypothetical protein
MLTPLPPLPDHHAWPPATALHSRATAAVAAPPPAEVDDALVWAHVLSLTGALLSHMAANPQTQRLVTDLLAAGLARHGPDAPSAFAPFDEPMSGLQTRELREPAVFSRFFGAHRGPGGGAAGVAHT